MFLADVTALADCYGGLPHVAEVINRKFNRCGSGSCLWQDVMDEPAFCLGLATMLRNYELFADAMKLGDLNASSIYALGKIQGTFATKRTYLRK